MTTMDAIRVIAREITQLSFDAGTLPDTRGTTQYRSETTLMIQRRKSPNNGMTSALSRTMVVSRGGERARELRFPPDLIREANYDSREPPILRRERRSIRVSCQVKKRLITLILLGNQVC